MIIADQSTQGILDPDCLKLAELHSDAVDYPKSGQPVPLNKIPRLKFPRKPDWNAPETLRKENDSYYESVRAIGKLFRSIDLPALDEAERVARSQRRFMWSEDDGGAPFSAVLEYFYSDEWQDDDDAVMTAVQERVAEFIRIDTHDDDAVREMWGLYYSYASQLRAVCADHTLSHQRDSLLTEEEAVVSARGPSRRRTFQPQLTHYMG